VRLLQSACVWSCTLNKAALLAATASADFTCKLWNAISGEEQHCWSHPHIVRSVHFASNTSQLATACHDKAIRIFDLGNPATDPIEFKSQRDTVRSAKFVNDDRSLLLSYHSSSGVDVLDVRSGEVVQRVPSSAPTTSINISYDGRDVTTASGEEVNVYDCATMKRTGGFQALQQVESASLSPDRQLMAVGGQDMWAYVLEFPTGKPLMV
jgi:serine-threonine kinase receptor-associated protein